MPSSKSSEKTLHILSSSYSLVRKLKITYINFIQKFYFQSASFLLFPMKPASDTHTNRTSAPAFPVTSLLILVSSIQTISPLCHFRLEQIKMISLSQQLKDNALDSLLGPVSAKHFSCWESKIYVKDLKPVKWTVLKHLSLKASSMKFIFTEWKLLESKHLITE